MKLTVASLRDSGVFTGPPVKREIAWEKDGETLLFDVYVRRLSYQTALTDIQAMMGNGEIAAARIAHCICDENGKPVFTVADVTGINADGSPVMDGNQERGALDGAITNALLVVIGEVNGLGKPKPTKSRRRKRSGTS